MLLRNFRNTVEFESCYSRVATPEMQKKLRYYQVGNSRDTDKVRNFYVRHFKNTVKFVLSSVKLPKTSPFNSWRKMHEWLVHKI